MEVVQLGLGVVDVATVAEGVVVSQVFSRAFDTEYIAPGVVGVVDELLAVAVDDGDHVALEVGDVVELVVVIDHRHGGTGGIVGEVHSMPIHGHVGQLVPGVGILVGALAVGPLGPQAVSVVGKLPLLRGTQPDHRGQLSAMLPGVIPDVVGQRIADLVIADDPAVVYLQLISPFGIIQIFCLGSVVCRYIVVRVNCPGQNITGIVIGPDRGGASLLVILPDQLIGRIVGIAGGISAVTDASDVAVLIVGVGIGLSVAADLNGDTGYLVCRRSTGV